MNEEELLKELKKTHAAIWDFLKKNGLTDLTDEDAFYDLFYDEEVRAEWLKLYGEFTRAFNAVLPRKEAFDYLMDWKSFTGINAVALKHLRDGRLRMKVIPHKQRTNTHNYQKTKYIKKKIYTHKNNKNII